MKNNHYMSTEKVWFTGGIIEPGTPVRIRWGIRWAHVYFYDEKLGKILRFAAKQKFVKI